MQIDKTQASEDDMWANTCTAFSEEHEKTIKY